MREPLPERPGLIAEFETGPGQAVLPEVHVVLRLDGDRFGRIRADARFGLETPFDVRFTKWLIQVGSDVLQTFPQARLGYVAGDELSFLFGRGAEEFGPGGFRFGIRVGAQATGRLSLLLGDVATFVPRVYQLPSDEWVVRYFTWRADALRAYALERHCHVTLGKSGLDEAAARRVIVGLSEDEKREVLSEHGLDFEGMPAWQRRGAVVWRKPQADSGPSLVIDTDLPEGEAFGDYVRRLTRPAEE